MGVSKNNGNPKSSILIGFSIINHPFWGTPIFGNIHIDSVHDDMWHHQKSSPLIGFRYSEPISKLPKVPQTTWNESGANSVDFYKTFDLSEVILNALILYTTGWFQPKQKKTFPKNTEPTHNYCR